MEQTWIIEAKKWVGTVEIPGPRTNPSIFNWLKQLKAWWTDDETPWCGVFVAYCMQAVGFGGMMPKNWMRAKEWLTFGTRLSKPVEGCIVVFTRDGGGHVGFLLGVNKAGELVVLGGNQQNMVRLSLFKPDRVEGYVWPTGIPLPVSVLPVIEMNDGLSINEA